jgi:uncharacterized membrane protein
MTAGYPGAGRSTTAFRLSVVVAGYQSIMTSDSRAASRDTLAAMLDTAVALEATEAALHRTADELPDPEAAARLDRLGDAITAQAKDIARRAGELPPNPPVDRIR